MIRDDFGQRLDKLLTSKGMTQEDLGDAVGRTKQAVSAWVTGKSYPGRQMIRKISKALGVPEDTLVVDESGLLDKKTLEAAIRVVRSVAREAHIELDDSLCTEMVYHAYLYLAAYTDMPGRHKQLSDFLNIMLEKKRN